MYLICLPLTRTPQEIACIRTISQVWGLLPPGKAASPLSRKEPYRLLHRKTSLSEHGEQYLIPIIYNYP